MSASAAETAHRRKWNLTVRGTRVRMLAAGSGDPLIYLHGSGDLGLWTPAEREEDVIRARVR